MRQALPVDMIGGGAACGGKVGVGDVGGGAGEQARGGTDGGLVLLVEVGRVLLEGEGGWGGWDARFNGCLEAGDGALLEGVAGEEEEEGEEDD